MNHGAGMPLRVGLALTAAVLAAHLWLLRASPPRVHPAQPARTAPFATRSLGATPGAGAAPVMPSAAASPRQAPAAPVRLATRPGVAPRLPGTTAPAPDPRPAEAGPPPVRVSIPAAAQLRYQVTASVRRQTTQGTSELAWRHDGASYEATFEVQAPLLRSRRQHSAGRLGEEGLEPLRFGDRGRGEQAAHFDRDEQRLVFSNNRPPAPLAAGAQDRLSVLLQLASLLAGDPARYPPGATVVIQTATTREAGEWAFTVEGEEQLSLPGGDVAAVKLTRPARAEFDQRIEVWLAPGQAYVPVRLRLTQPNGDWADHQWSATDRR